MLTKQVKKSKQLKTERFRKPQPTRMGFLDLKGFKNLSGLGKTGFKTGTLNLKGFKNL